MRQAAIYSAALHIAVISIVYFGVPALLSTPTIEDQPISVDLVSLEEATKAPPRPTPPKPEPPPQAAPAPPPPPAVTPEPPPPPPVAERPPEPPPQAKPEPPPPVPEPKPKPAAKPAPKPEPPPKPAAKPAPEEAKPEPKPQPAAAPKPKRKPVREDQFQALLKNLAKQKEAQQRSRTPEAKPAPTPAPPRQVARAAVDRQLSERRLTALVKQQLAPCWSIPGGAKDAQNMRVGVQIRLNTDGTLRGAPQVLDGARMRSDRVFRAVAESAVRALLNPRCSPLKLPYDQYDIWRNITFNFDPGEALGP